MTRAPSKSPNSVRALGVAVCLLAITLTACQRIDPASLDPVPALELDGYSAPIQRQLREGLAAVTASPTKAAPNGKLGMMLQTYKHFAAAAVMYRRARAIDPKSLRWAYLHATTLEAQGLPREAVAALRAALELEAYAPASVRLGELLAQLGETQAAATVFENLLAESAPPSEAYFSYGRFLLAQGEAARAVPLLSEALRMSGDFASGHYQLAQAYRQLGDAEAAQRHFGLAQTYKSHRAAGSDPLLNALVELNQSAMEFVQRARSLAERGQLDEAERYILLALERDPDNFAAHVSIVGLYTARGNFAKVDEHFARAQMLDPDNPKLYYNLGLARAAEDRRFEAREAFEKSRALDPTVPNTYVQLALLAQRDADASLARSYLEDALRLDPAHLDSHWLLGNLLAELGDTETAVTHLRRAAERPSRVQAQMLARLAETHALRGEHAAAEQALIQARQVLAGGADSAQRNAVAKAARRLADLGETAAPDTTTQ